MIFGKTEVDEHPIPRVLHCHRFKSASGLVDSVIVPAVGAAEPQRQDSAIENRPDSDDRGTFLYGNLIVLAGPH